ncbi:MAG: hypothetical protein LBU51_00565, partial [Bacteroidales bacterium]|nr:hypothetical protein [Bacteroidales bacterium]
MKYYQQLGVNDCAPACLAMIASYYKSYISIGKIRKLCKTDAMGTNLSGLIAAAENMGFKAKAFKGEISNKTLDSKIIFPFIAHIKIIYLDNMYDHFVVIRSIAKKNVEIWDPNPSVGKHIIEREAFLKTWTGHVLFLMPDSNFTPSKEKGNTLFKYAPLLLPYKKNLVIVCLASALLIIFGVLSSFYYKYVIDEIIITKAAFSLAALSIGILLIVIFQSVIEALRTILLNHLAYKADLQLDFSYLTHVLKLPIAFFDSMRTGEIISRFDDIEKIRDALSSTVLSIIMDSILLFVIGPILFRINAILFSIAAGNVLLISVIIYFFSKFYRKYFMKLRHEEAGVTSTLVEIINGTYTIKALHAEQMVFDNYEKSKMCAIWTNWKTNNIRILQGVLTGVINGVTGILIFWIGSSDLIKDTFSIGALLSFNALSSYFTSPLFRLVNLQSNLQEAFVAAERVSEILEMDVEQQDGLKFLKPTILEGEIDFNHVFFRYGMRSPVYTDLSFHIN